MSCAPLHQPRVPQHLEKHYEEKSQEAIAEPLAAQKFWRILFPGKAKPTAQQRKQLAAPTVAIAVCFSASGNGDNKRQEEANEPEPRKKNVYKAKKEINGRSDPKIIIPAFFHAGTSAMAMTAAGHSLAHFPQPIHFSASTAANMPPTTAMAFLGQTLRQHPQATHSACSTNATLFRFPVSRTKSTSSFNDISIQGGCIPIRDKLTVGHHSFRAKPPPTASLLLNL